MTDSEYAKLGVEPIAGDNPAGEDVQFDEDFEAIRREIAKLDSVTGESVGWSEIIEKGTDILANKSKHVQVATYLCLALFEREGFSGLASGLNVCHGLLVNFWEAMYPPLKRKRGRIEAFSWLAERGGAVAVERSASTGDLEVLKSIVEVMAKIEAVLSEKLGTDAPGLGELRRDLGGKVRGIEAKIKAAEAKAAAKTAAAAAGAPEIETVDEANKSLGLLRQNARTIAEFFRKANSTDPFAYRFLRSVNFSSLSGLPPHKDGVTQIPGVPAEEGTHLEENLDKKDYTAVIETAEARFATSVLWLDLQRYVLLAMEAAGEQYNAAREAIADELALFVKRLPEVVELKFANGMPFAAPPTVALLEEIVAGAGGGTGKVPGADGGDDRLTGVTRDAHKLAGRKKLAQAIDLLQKGIAQTGEKRAQFLWRLELARLCMEAGKMQLAIPQLEFLGSQIDEHHLEEWEPQLCREVFSTLYLAQKRLAMVTRPAKPELAEKMQQLHARLCRLDAAAALAINGKK